MNRIQVAQIMEEQGLVPLFFHPDIQVCKDVLRACYEGGSRILEFTNRGNFAHEIFSELSKFALKELPGMALGVGSVVDAGTAALYMQNAASFIVTPAFRRDIALACNRRKILWSPGCGSLTEICAAEELGCEIVKLFPGSVYGPGFVKSVKAPQPWTKIMPTGGVAPTEENLSSWFDAGVTCVGMGSKLLSKELIANRDYQAIREKCESTLQLIKSVRTS